MLSRLVITFLPRSAPQTLCPGSGPSLWAGEAWPHWPVSVHSNLEPQVGHVAPALGARPSPGPVSSLPSLASPPPILPPSWKGSPVPAPQICLLPENVPAPSECCRVPSVSPGGAPPRCHFPSIRTSCVSSHLEQKAPALSPHVSLLLYSQTPFKNWQDLASPFPLPGAV